MSLNACATQVPTPQMVSEAHRRLKEQSPLVHCLTNQVTVNLVANTLLAVGAAPVMADHPQEAGDVARQAGAVLVNLGTPSDHQIEAMHRAIAAAGEARVPWVLDPVGAGALTLRRRWAGELLAHRPTLLRGNAAEVIALGGQAEGGGRGVDSARASAEARDAARRLLARCGGVAVSGVQDRLMTRVDNDGRTCPLELRLDGGSALQARMTGSGCALGAMSAAYAAVCDDPAEAMLAAHAHAAATAERAEARADGPGSFAVAWLDALADPALDLAGFVEQRLEAEWLSDG
ncbi:hydroxyethylthiazole kinase [Modicisalibacter radicis]|uniref:hydroxyethylthiazole kinase n=1 Tax=Halomonas sp. EAR18 TaxID=2518972 RepID=UPI00109C07A7|nr:hydroxyethylthiazole kinase [Halomonas sp. EAR18]